jgi:hypothetical protein
MPRRHTFAERFLGRPLRSKQCLAHGTATPPRRSRTHGDITMSLKYSLRPLPLLEQDHHGEHVKAGTQVPRPIALHHQLQSLHLASMLRRSGRNMSTRKGDDATKLQRRGYSTVPNHRLVIGTNASTTKSSVALKHRRCKLILQRAVDLHTCNKSQTRPRISRQMYWYSKITTPRLPRPEPEVQQLQATANTAERFLRDFSQHDTT